MRNLDPALSEERFDFIGEVQACCWGGDCSVYASVAGLVSLLIFGIRSPVRPLNVRWQRHFPAGREQVHQGVPVQVRKGDNDLPRPQCLLYHSLQSSFPKGQRRPWFERTGRTGQAQPTLNLVRTLLSVNQQQFDLASARPLAAQSRRDDTRVISDQEVALDQEFWELSKGVVRGRGVTGQEQQSAPVTAGGRVLRNAVRRQIKVVEA